MTTGSKSRRVRRLVVAGGVIGAVVAAAVALIPAAISTPPARRWLLARADETLAPARFSATSLRFRWFGPTQIAGLRLIDAQGRPIVSAPSATWDRSLSQILFDRPRLGTLTLHGAEVAVRRSRDGEVDIAEALRPILRDDRPGVDLTVRVASGSLRFEAPILIEPVVAAGFDLTIRRPAAPAKIEWSATLKGPSRRLDIRGSADRWGPVAADGSRGFALSIRADRWPLAIGAPTLAARAEWTGDVEATRVAGAWSIPVRLAADRLELAGGALPGEAVREPHARFVGLARHDGSGWTVGDLDVSSAVVSARSSGVFPPRSRADGRIEGQVDLPALARQVPRALRLRPGTSLEGGLARFSVGSSALGDRGRAWEFEAIVSGLAARSGGVVSTLDAPLKMTSRLSSGPAGLAVDSVGLTAPGVDLSGSGDPDRGIAVAGTVDLGPLTRQLRESLTWPDREIAGRGPVRLDYRRAGPSYAGHLTADLSGTALVGGVDRDSIRLDARLTGPATGPGWPAGLDSASVAADAGEVHARLDATPVAGATDVALSIRSPVALGPIGSGLAHASISGRVEPDAVAIREARLGLDPGDPRRSPVELAMTGTYDRVGGNLDLKPAGPARGPIAIDPAGIRAHRLGSPDWDFAAGVRGEVAPGPSEPAGSPPGLWSATVSASPAGGLATLTAHARFRAPAPADGSAPDSWGLDATGRVATDRSSVVLDALEASTPYGSASATGRIDDPLGARDADITAVAKPDWAAINRVLARRVEPRATISGTVRPISIRGPLGSDGLRVDGGFDLGSAEVYGMHFGPAPIVVTAAGGGVAINRIETTLNGGRLTLDPAVSMDGGRPAAITLGRGSTIERARINDEVSRRVLSFVAPVLDQATRANGFVSVAVRRAEFPIASDAGRRAVVDADVAFQEVEFAPGPLAGDLAGLVGRTPPTIRLDKPVLLSVAGGRVRTKGLALPIAGVTELGLEGTVDFDRNLDLVASIPLTPAMVANRPVLGDIVSGSRVSIPIRGTLSKPEIDRDALAEGMGDMGKDLLIKGATRGALGILDKILQGRDPNAPPPPTAEERRARRLERRMERRGGMP